MAGSTDDKAPTGSGNGPAEANGENEFLARLAERVRAVRAQRGMTRKILSRHCGVSERYLAQLEGGKGNASVLVLRKIAHAMDVPLDQLVTEGREWPVDQRLILELLNRLDGQQLGEALAMLDQRFGAKARPDQSFRISLVGLRGAGKSTLGRRLADHLAIPFVELNQLIEQEYGAPINEILELSGQPTYRRYERRALERAVRDNERVVIATGGSLVTEPATLDFLIRNTLSVWIQASPDEHMNRVIEQGDLRPMADNREAMDDLKRILKVRDPFYSKAKLILDTAGKTEDQSFQDLLTLLSPYL